MEKENHPATGQERSQMSAKMSSHSTASSQRHPSGHLTIPSNNGHVTSRPPSAAEVSSMMEQPPQIDARPDGKKPQILVLKVGTSTLMDAQNGSAICLANLGKFVDAVCDLKDRGYHVVLISSGAVGVGCVHMHLTERPKKLVEKQAISAIGQCRLVRLWEDIFAIREKKAAQLLLTRTDLMDRPRFVSFRNTLLQLLKMDCIPIINENDALAGGELKFGDNDTLGAYVSVSIGASWFFMLTDVDCLFTANPRHHPEARPVAYVSNMDKILQSLDDNENDGTAWGSGGMRTKILAAKLCVATGIHTGLCHGAHPERILNIVAFAQGGTTRKSPGTLDTKEPGVFPIQPISREAVSGLRKVAQAAITRVTTPVTQHDLKLEDMSPSVETEPSPNPSTGQHHSDEEEEDTDSKSSSSYGDPKEPCVSDAVGASTGGASATAKSKNCIITFRSISRMPYIGTIFAGQHCTQQLRDQRRWILSLPVRGTIYINEHTIRAVIEKRKSLTAAGIVAIKDVFYPGEALAIYPSSAYQADHDDSDHAELARCLVNFSSDELDRIKGKKSCEFQHILGYYCAHEVAYKSNIIFVNPAPVYEKYKVEFTEDMLMSSDEEDNTGLETPEYNPIPLPVEGGEMV